MDKYTLEKTFETLLEEKKYLTLRDVLMTFQPADIASLFEEMPDEKIPLLFRLIPKETAAETFVEMESDRQELLIRGFSDAELKAVVDELYVDDAVDIVEEMPANVVKRILLQADPETRTMINEILNYPEDSAGSVMTTEYVTLRKRMTVGDAIKRIRRTGVDKETIYTCYVTDNARMLEGTISLKTLILSGEDETIGDVMNTNFVSVRTTADQEEVAALFSKYGLSAIPVVDMEGRLVGIVTFDDAMGIMEEEATEDIEKMAAITPSDRPYMKMSIFQIWKSRIPWLLILMISATFTGIIISSFEHALAAQTALTAFIPMLMNTGGNAGSQASVTVIRGISLGDLKMKDLFYVMWKEIRIAVLCGVSLAAVNFIKILLVDIGMLRTPGLTLSVALVVCLTLVVTVLFSKIVGSALPLIARRIGFDPAVMAGPFITTIVDAISLLVYFRVASIILGT